MKKLMVLKKWVKLFGCNNQNVFLKGCIEISKKMLTKVQILLVISKHPIRKTCLQFLNNFYYFFNTINLFIKTKQGIY